MSLPYGLKMYAPYSFRPNGKESTGVFRIVFLTGDLYADIENNTFPEDFKPILHPLSDLTKEIEHKGERFVPMRKLLENACFNLSKMSDNEINGYYDVYFNMDLVTITDALLMAEWHFDIAGLIEKGEAIDVNTLSENLYK